MTSLESLLTCVRHEHEYSVQKLPTQPIPLMTSCSSSSSSSSSSVAAAAPPPARPISNCNVCHQNIARYTCPRCSIPYCSLGCYNQHGGGGGGNNTNNNKNVDDCREGFYRDRTAQFMDLQVKERLDDTNKLIQRVYQQQQQEETNQQEISSSFSQFTQEELLNIMHCLEEGDESKIERVVQSDKVRRALVDAVDKGELLDYVLEDWMPWWRPEIMFGPQSGIIDDEIEGRELRGQTITLDERLSQVPALSKLHSNPSRIPDLRYNVVDILYATAWTLRLYHGCTNALEMGMDAGDTLIRASCVLSRDARYDDLSHALTSCTVHSTRSMKQQSGNSNASWSCLTQDVALICDNRRYVAKALCEAIDILRNATLTAKQQREDKDDDKSSSSLSLSKSAALFRKCRKKVEFYLTWCREPSNADVLDGLSRRIESWSADWKLSEHDEGLHNLDRITSTTVTPRRSSGDTDLLKVVSTTRRR